MSTGRAEAINLERPIEAAAQLIVEGRGAEMFFREFVTDLGLTERLDVRTFGDINRGTLKHWLELFTRKPAFKQRVRRLGVVRDAEQSPADAAFLSAQSALRDAGLPVPERMGEPSGDPLAVRVFVLPNCGDAGMLEDLCLTAIREAEAGQAIGLLPCVEGFFACLKQQGHVPGNPAKARFAGYALARDVIDPQLGRAAQKRTIPWKAKAFDPLKAFLHGLADERRG